MSNNINKQLNQTEVLLGLLNETNKNNRAGAKVMATIAGFSTVKNYKAHLVSSIKLLKDLMVDINEVKVNKLIHVVDILDASGSMYGKKIDNAKAGIIKGVKDLGNNIIEGLNYTYTAVSFSNYGDVIEHFFKSSLNSYEIEKEINYIKSRNSTALYDTIGATINKFINDSKTEKVLINIYTDGSDNDSKNYKIDSIKKLINDLNDNFTITFIGTAIDVRNLINNAGIDESNTLIYDGSARGLELSMNRHTVARQEYSSKVSKGISTKKGFYKSM